LPPGPKDYVARGSGAEDRNVARVRASFAALDARDETAFLAGLADDAVLEEMADLEPMVGKPKVKAWFETWTGAVADARTEIATVLGVGDFVLAETVVRGTLNGTLGRFSSKDKPFAVHRAAVVQVKGGKLVRISSFMNGKELAESLGQWPPKAGR
jgi:ketosteroid isomerase-like protein